MIAQIERFICVNHLPAHPTTSPTSPTDPFVPPQPAFLRERLTSVVQTNPASNTQVKYAGIRNQLMFEPSFNVMDGQTNYTYQPDTPPDAVRMEDATLGESDFAATREEHQPNQRLQFDSTASYSVTD